MDTQTIRDHMPETYKAIGEMAGLIGKEAYRYVRLGLKGHPNKFYAIEKGWVVGTPFDIPEVEAELARYIVRFGMQHLIMWAPESQQQKVAA